ncbi:hypothetical protein PRZ48_009595, partial [Zasmidium cellare]
NPDRNSTFMPRDNMPSFLYHIAIITVDILHSPSEHFQWISYRRLYKPGKCDISGH